MNSTERRIGSRDELRIAGEALATFLKSPQGKDVPEYIGIVMGVDSLVDETPELTYRKIGQFEVVQLLTDMQKR